VGKYPKRINKAEREYRRYRRSEGVWMKGWVMVIEAPEWRRGVEGTGCQTRGTRVRGVRGKAWEGGEE